MMQFRERAVGHDKTNVRHGRKRTVGHFVTTRPMRSPGVKRDACFGDTERIGKTEGLLLRNEIPFKFARFITARPITETMVPEFNAVDGCSTAKPVEIVGSVRLERITENSEISFQPVCLTIPPFRYGAVRKNASPLPCRHNGSAQNYEDCRREDALPTGRPQTAGTATTTFQANRRQEKQAS